MLTPQSNTTLTAIAQVLRDHDSFAICGHVNPDGDCLGSQLALAHALRKLGKQVDCLLARNESVPHNLRFLPGSDLLQPAEGYMATPQVFVAVDVPTPERLGDAAAVQERCDVRVTMDHHATDGCMAQYNYVDPDAAACCCIVWELVGLLGAKTQPAAQCALTGMITDTGRFSYQNTNQSALEAAADAVASGGDPALVAREFFQNNTRASMELKKVVLSRMTFACDGAFAYAWLGIDDFSKAEATRADAEALIDELRDVAGVRVALLLRQSVDGQVRGSLRAKDETDVAQVARFFDGGGHKAAAGFTYHGDMQGALRDCVAAVERLCFQERA